MESMSDRAQPRGKQELVGVQLLRGWAAATVAVAHLTGQMSHHTPELLGTGIFPATMGVDIFFVISGFIMIHTSYGRFGGVDNARNFIVRRLIRIVPLYWFFTLVILAALFLSPDAFHTTSFDWENALGSFLFFPVARESGLVKPILSLGWTLNYEMLFYALFAVGLLFTRRIGLIFLYTAIALLITLGMSGIDLPDALRFWSATVIAEFLYGVTIGLLFQRLGSYRIPFAWWAVLFAAAVGLAVLLTAIDAAGEGNNLMRAVEWGIPAALMIALATIVLPNRGIGWVINIGGKIGDSSYALYLSHKFLFGAATLIWAKTIGFKTLPYWVPTFALLAVSLLGGYVVHLLIERPVTGYLNSLLKREVRTSATQHVLEGDAATAKG